MMMKVAMSLWLFACALQLSEAHAESQTTIDTAEQALQMLITDLVFCNTEDGAKRVAEAIASIKTPNDGLLAYTLYLHEPECSFTNMAVVDTNRALWAYSSPHGLVYVFQSIEAIIADEDDQLPYIVFAPLELMYRFQACEMFLDEATNTIEGCEVSL